MTMSSFCNPKVVKRAKILNIGALIKNYAQRLFGIGILHVQKFEFDAQLYNTILVWSGAF